MENLLGPLIFIAIIVISLLGKLKKKADEESPLPPGETPDLNDLPEMLRRMFTGDTTVRKARPAAPKEDEDTGWQPVQPVTIPRPQQRDMPYRPPVARPAAPRESAAPAPPRQQRPIVVEPPVARPAARPVAAPAAQEEEGPRRRPALAAPRQSTPPRTRSAAFAVSLPLRTLRQPAAQMPAEPAKKTGQPVPSKRPSPAHALLRDIDDVRRGIILREILGPPVSMR